MQIIPRPGLKRDQFAICRYGSKAPNGARSGDCGRRVHTVPMLLLKPEWRFGKYGVSKNHTAESVCPCGRLVDCKRAVDARCDSIFANPRRNRCGRDADELCNSL